MHRGKISPVAPRRNEKPIAVASKYEYWRRPDGGDFDVAIYSDGSVIGECGRRLESLSPERVRQVEMSLIFPGDGYDAFVWETALRDANKRQSLATMEKD